MSDADYRSRERQFMDVEAKAQWISERVRLGVLCPKRVEHAAKLGDEASQAVTGLEMAPVPFAGVEDVLSPQELHGIREVFLERADLSWRPWTTGSLTSLSRECRIWGNGMFKRMREFEWQCRHVAGVLLGELAAPQVGDEP